MSRRDVTKIAATLEQALSEPEINELGKATGQEWPPHERTAYANLRRFDTGNEHIAEGFIWASLAAAILKRFLAHAAQKARGCFISTRKVAMCARVFLRRPLAAPNKPRLLRATLAQIVDFLEHNAQRAALERDRRRGCQSVGLDLCGTA